MAEIRFDTAEVAATPAHEMGVWVMKDVPDEEVVERVAALHTLGFNPEVVL